MGRDKASLDFGGKPLASHMVAELQRGASEVFVVGNGSERYAANGVASLSDAVDGVGPIGGILAGIRAMSSDVGFVIACDMPFLTAELLAFVADRIGADEDGVMVRADNGIEPLCAAYRKRLATRLEAMIRDGETAARAVTRWARIAFVDSEELEQHGFHKRSWFNMNTPQDYERALRLWRASPNGR